MGHFRPVSVVLCIALLFIEIGNCINSESKVIDAMRVVKKLKDQVVVTGRVINVPLHRSTIGQYETVLLSLKMRQSSFQSSARPLGAAPYTQLLEANDIPLTQEILREKHLATYYGVVQIGDTNFRILFDTGSCEFWVPSTDCSTTRCKRHIQYPYKPSPRFSTPTHLDIQYLSGKVTGNMIYDTVKTGEIEVKNQIVGVASKVDIALLDDVIWDGILGLAYPNPSLTHKGVVPFFDNVIKQNILPPRGLANQFAYFIDDEKGSVTFGGVNCDLINDLPYSSKFRGGVSDDKGCISKFHFTPVSEKSYWTIKLDDVRAQYPDGREFKGLCAKKGCVAIVDTGTYLLYGPDAQVKKVMRADIASCEEYSNLPTFFFDIAEENTNQVISLALRPIDYVLKFESSVGEDCVIGISPDRDTIWTLGQVFLRSYYTLFDRGANRIGFARIPRNTFQAINSKSLNS